MSDAFPEPNDDKGKSFLIPIAKAGNKNIEITVEVLESIPEGMYRMLLAEGLKAVLNKRMSKIGSVTKLVGEEQQKAHASALKIADENLDSLKKGTVKAGRTAAADGKTDRITLTAAMRLAREAVKDTARKAGVRISTIAASEITAAAKLLLEADGSYLEQAKADIAARAAKATDVSEAKAAIEKLGLREDPKKVAALNAKAEERKAQLSAKQAGIVAPRKAAQPSAHH